MGGKTLVEWEEKENEERHVKEKPLEIYCLMDQNLIQYSDDFASPWKENIFTHPQVL